MRRIGCSLCLVLFALASFASSDARAEFDWPLDWRLPSADISVGLSGGLNFGEEGSDFNAGPAFSATFAWHHGLLGLRAAVGAKREGLAMHVGATVDVLFWYVVLIGGGASYWEALEEPGREIPREAWGVGAFVGVPIPVMSLEGGGGTLVLLPYGRPGIRFGENGDVQGHHEIGISLEYTTFGF
jgi:hypothetical protein